MGELEKDRCVQARFSGGGNARSTRNIWCIELYIGPLKEFSFLEEICVLE